MGHCEKGRPSKRIKSSSSKEEFRSVTIVDDDDPSFSKEAAEDDCQDGADEGKKKDFTKLELKPDHANRPLWARADGKIFLEFSLPCTSRPMIFSSLLMNLFAAYVFWRPESMHEYNLTPHSLYAAVSVGLETETIISLLNKLSKAKLPKEMVDFIYASTANYEKVKLVLKRNRYFVESPFPR